MTMKVGIPAVIGATGGGAVGFLFGGPAGAATGSEIGAAVGLKIGVCIWGTSAVEGMAKQAFHQALSIADMGARYLLAFGLVSFAYWGTSKNTQESCTINSQHQVCQIFPYVNFGLLIFSAAAITFTIGKSIFNINPNQKSDKLVCEPQPHFCSLSTDNNPFKIFF